MSDAQDRTRPTPLAGLRVVELTHMVMGPAAGAILVELGADVVRIEPVDGDPTRTLLGSGAGYFPMYNRNKRSVCIDIKRPEGAAVARRLIASCDVLVENFRPGALERLGLGYERLREDNERLIYCSEKGFLGGPYQDRTALDEVVQMMSGLAYMTGPPGTPLRAGASVVDVTGGMFGVIGILAALQERERTGRGQRVSSALFETAVYLVGQHMAQLAVTGEAAPPMPARISAWAIYDIFTTRDGGQVFLGIVSDGLWQKFCERFGLEQLAGDPEYRTNAQRVRARPSLLPQLRAIVSAFSKVELLERLEGSGLPYAGIGRPEEMFADPHLLASGGLVTTQLPDGRETRLPALPIELSGNRPNAGGRLPRPGEDSRAILSGLGIGSAELDRLTSDGVIGAS
ncbi:MAG: CoA transferase [Gammaproteobacteria bacterium]|nr:CoA transferase [Gammaproteobacteria bacterium]